MRQRNKPRTLASKTKDLKRKDFFIKNSINAGAFPLTTDLPQAEDPMVRGKIIFPFITCLSFLVAILFLFLESNLIFAASVNINAQVPGGAGPLLRPPSPLSPSPLPPEGCEPTTVICSDWLECIEGQQSRTCSDGCTSYTETQECGVCFEDEVRRCGLTDVGECEYGSQVCSEGLWTDCLGAVYPVTEICDDNLDNDCDGLVDENCQECSPEGASRQCGVTNLGICQYGEESCLDGFWAGCIGAIYPQDEICGDNLDNDCDGLVDEGCICNPVWECTDWSGCVEGQQSRTCLDLSECGIIEGKPKVEKSCLAECTLSCGSCQKLDLGTCYCLNIYPCCGDGICEGEENFLNCASDCPLIPPPKFQCSDNIDNDNDGLTDYPGDFGCRDDLDNSEVSLAEHLEGVNLVGATREIVDAGQKYLVKNKYLSPIGRVVVRVFDNPAFEKKTRNILAPLLAIIAIANTASSFPLINLLIFLRYLLGGGFLAGFISRRRRQGVVFDSLTKKPIDLAIVRLFKKEDISFHRTRVTDIKGRYSFLLPPGSYYMTVDKAQYTFPSNYLKGTPEEDKLRNLYHGQEFDVETKKNLIVYDIPLDFQQEVIPNKKLIRQTKRQKYHKIISNLIVSLSLITVLIIPSAFTFTFFGGNCLLYIIFRRFAYTKRPKSWGIVYDRQTGRPLPKTITKIYDQKYNTLLESQVTDSRGRYGFSVDRNIYYIRAEKEGYQTKEIGPIDLVIKPRDHIVGLDIGLEKSSQDVKPPKETSPKPEIITPPPLLSPKEKLQAREEKGLKEEEKAEIPIKAEEKLTSKPEGEVEKIHTIPDKAIGEITHYFGKIGVGVVKLTNTLKVGDKIIIKGHGKEFEQIVESMQIEHQQIQEAKASDLIGLKVSKPVKKGDKVYLKEKGPDQQVQLDQTTPEKPKPEVGEEKIEGEKESPEISEQKEKGEAD